MTDNDSVMSPYAEAIGAVSFLFGTSALWISLMRVRTVKEMQKALLNVASCYWADAGEANQQTDETVVTMHNWVVATAALAPAIAVRAVTTASPSPIASEKWEQIGETLSRNAWVLPHILTASLALDRLEFHAEPWKVNRLVRATLAWVMMSFMVDSRGIVRWARTVDRTRQSVRDLSEMDMRDGWTATA